MPVPKRVPKPQEVHEKVQNPQEARRAALKAASQKAVARQAAVLNAALETDRRLKAAKAALRVYGRHQVFCPRNRCTCGWAQVEAQLETW